LKYTKEWSEPVSQPFGLPLEIMPLQNPFEVTVESTANSGLYEGNLIKDVLVEYLGETVNVNEQGLLHPTGEGGLQVIEASYQPHGDESWCFLRHHAEPVPEPSACLLAFGHWRSSVKAG